MIFHIKITLSFAFLCLNLEVPQDGVITEEPVHQEENVTQNQEGNN